MDVIPSDQSEIFAVFRAGSQIPVNLERCLTWYGALRGL